MNNFRLLSVVASLLMMTATIAQNTNSIFGTDVSIPKGETITLEVNFTFDEEYLYTGFSYDLSLPEGITIDKKSNGKLNVSKGDNLEDTHSLSSNYVTEEGVYAFACYSGDTDPIRGTSGTLMTIKLKANPSIKVEDFPQIATIKNVKISTVVGTEIKLEKTEFTISIVSDGVTLEETSTTAPAPIIDTKVVVKRNIKAEEWSTICLPFAMSESLVKEVFGNDVKLGNFTGCSTTKTGDNVASIVVSFEAATEIAPNHPYIIWVSSPITEFTIENTTIVEPTDLTININNNKFIGNYVAETVLPENSLFLNGNKFWYSNGNKMKAFRAYFLFDDVLSDKNANSNVTLAFDEEDGINQVTTDQPAEGIYDIQGRKVHTDENKWDNLKKGVYIINGKKVVK